MEHGQDRGDSRRCFLGGTFAAEKSQVAQKLARESITRVRLLVLASRESMKLRICSVQLLRHGCRAGRKIRAVTLAEDTRIEWTMIANFEVKYVVNSALGSGDACGMSISAASASLCREPSLSSMTHVQHGQHVHESTDHALDVLHCVGGLRAWPIDKCSNKDVGRSERET